MRCKRVRVTQRHIRKGTREDGNSCPIALAIRARKGVKWVEVGGGVAEIYEAVSKDVTRVTTYKLPRNANRFIGAFDLGEEVKPFSFDLGKLIEDRME